MGDETRTPLVVRSAYGYDSDRVSDDTGLACLDPSKTIQSQAAETDINEIVRRFGITGQIPQVARPPSFEDFGDGVFDFQSAQNLIVEANRSFMAMDARVRARFGNDPGEFVAFCSNEKNADEMRALGLTKPREPVDALPVVAQSPAATV
ncbi:MAG: internal scaffolding protein [Microvirus sp.]|nr:MAG: internal scaffolding protein [Microvirus sp.]